MRVCGLELSKNDAIPVLVDEAEGELRTVETGLQRISLSDLYNAEELKVLKDVIEEFLENHKVDIVVIRKRLERGLYSGSATSFKLESLFQLAAKCPVEFLSPQSVATFLKKNPVEWPEVLHKYQRPAFATILCFLKNPGK